MSICIAADGGGKGGVAGGGGSAGQASQNATGAGAHGYGYPVIELTSAQAATVTVQLTEDYDGAVPFELTTQKTAKFIAKASYASAATLFTKDCVCSTAGVVTISFTAEETAGMNGIWYSEIQIPDVSAVFRAYLCIRKGLTDDSPTPNTLTVMDVRLALMDTSAEANQMLDDLEFSDMMILHAVQRCIDEWNETPPELGRRFDATNFPYKEHLMKGVIGYLMQMLSYRFLRNNMQYNASGFNLDKNDKGPQYSQLANDARSEWRVFIMSKKSELNMLECFGSIDMPYFG